MHDVSNSSLLRYQWRQGYFDPSPKGKICLALKERPVSDISHTILQRYCLNHQHCKDSSNMQIFCTLALEKLPNFVIVNTEFIFLCSFRHYATLHSTSDLRVCLPTRINLSFSATHKLISHRTIHFQLYIWNSVNYTFNSSVSAIPISILAALLSYTECRLIHNGWRYKV